MYLLMFLNTMNKFVSDKNATVAAINLLREKYSPPEWGFLDNVWNGDEEEKRYADGLAFSTFKRSNFEIHAFELKSSRNDWKREMNDPQKSQWFMDKCHRFWAVSTKKNIIKKEELPMSWGLLEIDNNEIHTVVPALLKNNTEHVPIGLVGVILRHMVEQMSRSHLGTELIDSFYKGYREGYEKGKEDYDYEVDRLKYRVKSLEKTLYSRKNKYG